MGYRKLQADRLFTGREMLSGQVLVVNDDGSVEDIVAASEAGGDIEKFDGILSPGFVNCHCHLELSHMKDKIARRTGLPEFVYSVITQRHYDKEVMLDAIEKAESSMIENGIVAVGDICNNPISLLQKIKRRMYYHNFIEASGFVPAVVEERFKRSTDLFNAFAELYAVPSATNSIVPHAPYSVAAELFKKIAGFPGNRILTMHNQEDEAENELYRNKSGGFLELYGKMNIDASSFMPTGKTSLQSCLPYFFVGQKLILVHNVVTAAEDIEFVGHHGTPELIFCLCPNANLYISGLLPPVELLVKSGVKLVLGTDSLASNDELSILGEMRVLRENFSFLSDEQLLGWGTLNGAEALEVDGLFGSFERSKRPGVVVVDEGFGKVRRII